MRLLAVERQASLLTSKLPDDATFVVRTDAPDDALSMLRHESYDLVVLDLASLPESGFMFLRSLRTAGDGTPVVAITSRQSGDRVRALGLGADDAVDQKIDIGELTARIQAVFRRHRGYSRSVLEVGDLSLSVETREVRFKDRLIDLTGREYLTLKLLVLRRGQFVTKDMFLNHLYGGMDEPDTKIIDVFICKLRKKLTAAGADGIIGTVWGRGYTLRDPVQAQQHASPASRSEPIFSVVQATIASRGSGQEVGSRTIYH
nr:response regulator transcription factor [uncultured Rhodopila sp.]